MTGWQINVDTLIGLIRLNGL